MTLQFLQPHWLWLLLPLLVLVGVSSRRLRGEEFGRLATVLSMRALLFAVMTVAIAQPMLSRVRDDVAVVAVVDVSESVRRLATAFAWGEGERAPLARSQEWLSRAVAERHADDRFGIVVFDGAQSVLATPTRRGMPDDSIDRPIADGTDIAGAVRLARALFPADAARRLLLISDGNETRGVALDAATAAAADPRGSIPIDVLPITYRLDSEVQIVRIEAPTATRTGQSVTLRLVLSATRPTSGRLTVTHEGEILDLDPDGSGTAMLIDVAEGYTVQPVRARIDGRPLHRFSATFEPDDPSHDTLAENNRAETLITNAGANAALLIRGRERRVVPSAFEQLLRSASIPVTVGGTEALPNDLLGLQAFDLLILDDVGAHEMDVDTQAMIAEYVDRLGGGLLITGGPNSFGAGGWRGSPLEPIFPVDLDVPRQLQRPSAALVLVLDKSGSMSFPVAGARATQQEVANEAAALAVESLGARSLVGVIAFDSDTSVIVPLAPNDDPESIVERIRGIAAGGGTNIASGLAAAEEMLEGVEVEQRQVVFLTDGRSAPGNERAIAERLAAGGARITTIGVGNDIDVDLLRELSEIGGGAFHMVRNPSTLPRVLVDSVRMVNRPLVREEAFDPQPRPTGTGLLAGLGPLPPLGGLVLTTARPSPDAILEIVAPTGEPVLATWPAGLGRVAAFTSDLDGPWASDWLRWSGWSRLWTELARRTARPALGAGLSIETSIDDRGLTITVDIDPEAEDALDPSQLAIAGVVYAPDGSRSSVRLRQVAARRFEATVAADEPGAHVVAISPVLGDRPLSPLVAAATRTAGEEHRANSSNVSLLREIADATGGRLMEWNDPRSPTLFDRRGLEPTRSIRPIWPFLAWTALALLVADVAGRRIAWSPSRLRARVHDAARLRTGERARSAAETLARTRAPRPTLTPQTEAPLRAPKPSRGAPRPIGPISDPLARARALAALSGDRDEPPAADHDPTSAQTQSVPEAPLDAEADDAMGRLLAAKRRARGAERDDGN